MDRSQDPHEWAIIGKKVYCNHYYRKKKQESQVGSEVHDLDKSISPLRPGIRRSTWEYFGMLVSAHNPGSALRVAEEEVCPSGRIITHTHTH